MAAATSSGRSQFGQCPVSGKTISSEEGIAALKRSWSSRENSPSWSPQSSNVGSVSSASCPVSSVLEQPVDQHTPETWRQLQTLLDEPLEKVCRHRVMDRALLKLAGERFRNGIGKIAKRDLQLPRDRIGGRETGADQHERRDAFRMGEGGLARDEGAERVACERCAFDFQRVEQRDRVGSQVLDPIAGFRALRLAVAPLIDGYGIQRRRQQRQDAAERER